MKSRKEEAMATQTVSEMKAHITDKAAKDGDFRARLIADPKAVIASASYPSLRTSP